jgi:hypothetical protein
MTIDPADELKKIITFGHPLRGTSKNIDPLGESCRNLETFKGFFIKPKFMENVNLNLNELPPFMCACGNGFFVKVYQLKVVAPFKAGNSEPFPIAVECHACDKCGEIVGQESIKQFKPLKP